MSDRKLLFFNEPILLPIYRDGLDYVFTFSMVDYELHGTPEERAKTTSHSMQVGISGTLRVVWNYQEDELEKILFEIGKRHVIQKVKDGTLTADETLLLTTANTDQSRPFDPDRIEDPEGERVVVDLPKKNLLSDASEIILAAKIIDTRDNINALFKYQYKENLFELHQERNLLELFRPADTQEEFVYRLTSLANLATSINNGVLRRITGITDTSIKSIGLLEGLFNNDKSGTVKRIIDVLRQLNKLRQAYPVHGDQVHGVIEAHNYFGFVYPITNHNESWRTLLLNYYECLELILNVIRSSKFED